VAVAIHTPHTLLFTGRARKTRRQPSKTTKRAKSRHAVTDRRSQSRLLHKIIFGHLAASLLARIREDSLIV